MGNRARREEKGKEIITGELQEKKREKRKKKNGLFVQRGQFHPRAVLVTV